MEASKWSSLFYQSTCLIETKRAQRLERSFIRQVDPATCKEEERAKFDVDSRSYCCIWLLS